MGATCLAQPVDPTRVEVLLNSKSTILSVDREEIGTIKTKTGEIGLFFLRAANGQGEAQEGVRLRIVDQLTKFETNSAYVDSKNLPALLSAVTNVVAASNKGYVEPPTRGGRVEVTDIDASSTVEYATPSGIRFYVYTSKDSLYVAIERAVVFLNQQQSQQLLELLRKATGMLR